MCVVTLPDPLHSGPSRSSPWQSLARARTAPILAGLATLFALWLRLFRLENPGYWGDELMTREYAHEPWSRLFGDLALVDVHPPFYYALQHAWLAFGESRFAMRSLSAALGAACIPLVFLLGRRLVDDRAGVVSAFMVAIAPLHLIASREIRQYSLLAFFALLAILGFSHLLPVRDEAEIGSSELDRRAAWLAYVVGAVGAFYTHNTALFLPALASGAVLVFWSAGRVNSPFVARWIGANVLVGALAAPWLWLTFHHLSHTLARFWIPDPSVDWVKSQLLGAYPYPRLLKPVFVLLALWAVWSLRRERLLLTFLVVFWLGEPLAMWFASYLRPLLYCRPLIWSTLLFPIVVAAALVRLPGPAFASMAAAFVLLQAYGLSSSFPAERETMGFEALAPRLSGLQPGRDVLVVAPIQFDPELRVDVKGYRENAVGIAYGDLPEKLFQPMWVPQVQRSELYARVCSYRRVWFYTETASRFPPPPGDDFARVMLQLESHSRSEKRWASQDRLLVLFDMQPPHAGECDSGANAGAMQGPQTNG